MSDLAPFVAATLRDKVIADLQSEIEQLKAQSQRERDRSQAVEITGPRGNPVYSQATFRSGNYDHSPELWKVEFVPPREPQQQSACTLAELGDMEVRIGGICKARLANGIVEGFVNDLNNNFNPQEKSGIVSIWFGGSSGIWLNIRIHPIERVQYAALRDFDLGGENLLTTLLQFFSADSIVEYVDVSFLISYINGAMENWGIPPEPPEEESAIETGSR